jgi:hypothetical protein
MIYIISQNLPGGAKEMWKNFITSEILLYSIVATPLHPADFLCYSKYSYSYYALLARLENMLHNFKFHYVLLMVFSLQCCVQIIFDLNLDVTFFCYKHYH